MLSVAPSTPPFAPQGASRSDSGCGRSTKKFRVMVAEDDPELRSLVVSVLARAGYDAQSVGDGADLLDAVTRNLQGSEAPIDLVLSDIAMPLLDGISCVERFRALGFCGPVVLMTGFGDNAVRARTSAMGVSLLDKPFALDELRAAVLAALSSRS